MRKLVVLAAVFSLCLSGADSLSLAAPGGAVSTMEELRSQKLKSLAKRDPRAEDLINKAQDKINKLKESKTNPALAGRLQEALDQIAFGSSGLSETRLKVDMELLEAIVKDHKEPSSEELMPLQERYKKLCTRFDDTVFNKDLDRAFHVHDKLVRFTALGLWDKDKISAEIERLEGLVERAPDIPYGKSQLFDTCKNKRLVSVPKLVYLGSSAHEEMFLTGDRRSVGIIDEGCGQPLNLELAEHVIQGPTGKFSNLNDCNDPALGLPFSPPLSLWAKARIQDGRVPGILLKLVDSKVKADNPAYSSTNTDTAHFVSVAEVATGKIDDYLRNNLSLLGLDKTPVLLGLFADFDREAAAGAFGADGQTAFYSILDPKLKDMPAQKREDELHKRYEKGFYTSNKGNAAGLCNEYGDAEIPDGPERVRDAWKRLKKLVLETGSSSISLFSFAGNFHGNKNAGKFSQDDKVGNQAWNKLEYYWPGEGVIDWLGINSIGTDPQSDPKGANLLEALDSFMAEQRNSAWQPTPVMLVDLAPGHGKSPLSESSWITTVFTKTIPSTFPNILVVFIDVPRSVTLWNSESRSAFRNYVGNNKFYNWKLRFKLLDAAGASSAH